MSTGVISWLRRYVVSSMTGEDLDSVNDDVRAFGSDRVSAPSGPACAWVGAPRTSADRLDGRAQLSSRPRFDLPALSVPPRDGFRLSSGCRSPIESPITK